MECDICLEKYDKTLNKPLTLIRCAHTICAQCTQNLPTKDCPTCRRQIEATAVNWLVFNLIQSESESESEFNQWQGETIEAINDKVTLAKTLSELIEKKETRIHQDTIKRHYGKFN